MYKFTISAKIALKTVGKMITLDKISKKIPNRTLFDDVSATFNRGARYGLTGPNGAGKSTLMKIIMGIEPPTSGQVILPPKVGFLRQNIEEFADFRVIDVVIMGNQKLWDALVERDKLYDGEMTDEVGMRLGDLEEIVAEEDGYSAEADAEILLEGMGIEKEFYEKKMNEIPTDRQFRALLCQALFGNPDALLLDEPTNHLDLDSIRWLEDFLHSYTGTLIVISHDRHFLNTIATQIADIDYDTIITYPGNYDQMIATKTSAYQRQMDENKAKEKKAAQLKEFVAKFSAGTRASQVQSRLKEIEKLKPEDQKKTNIQRPYIRFILPDLKPGQKIFDVKHLEKSYDKPIIQDFSFEILRGDKIGIIGNNGKGKTTLLKLLAKEIAPDNGSVEEGHNVKIGYFPQNHKDVLEKYKHLTLFEYLKMQKQGIYDQEIRSYLGKMLFAGDDAFKKIENLSGGESARLLLAAITIDEPNVLLLDEPNNHLDLEAVSALAWALDEFKGTVLFISHDQDLMEKAAKKLIAFEDDEIHFFTGTFKEYFSKKNK